MTNLDRMIAELCPDGISYIKLGDVCQHTKNIKWSNEQETTYQYIDLTSVDRAEHRIVETTMISASNRSPLQALRASRASSKDTFARDFNFSTCSNVAISYDLHV